MKRIVMSRASSTGVRKRMMLAAPAMPKARLYPNRPPIQPTMIEPVPMPVSNAPMPVPFVAST